jgi:ketosteroid isomerase-like protein
MSDLKKIKAVYDAFARKDILGVLEVLSADIAWTEAEGFPYGGTYHGPRPYSKASLCASVQSGTGSLADQTNS